MDDWKMKNHGKQKNCMFVLFDRDGPIIDELKTWDW